MKKPKTEKLKIEKFRVVKLNNPSSINGGINGGDQGETVLGDIIRPTITR